MKCKASNQYNKGNEYMSESNKYLFYNLIFQTQPHGLDDIRRKIKFMVNK